MYPTSKIMYSSHRILILYGLRGYRDIVRCQLSIIPSSVTICPVHGSGNIQVSTSFACKINASLHLLGNIYAKNRARQSVALIFADFPDDQQSPLPYNIILVGCLEVYLAIICFR